MYSAIGEGIRHAMDHNFPECRYFSLERFKLLEQSSHRIQVSLPAIKCSGNVKAERAARRQKLVINTYSKTSHLGRSRSKTMRTWRVRLVQDKNATHYDDCFICSIAPLRPLPTGPILLPLPLQLSLHQPMRSLHRPRLQACGHRRHVKV